MAEKKMVTLEQILDEKFDADKISSLRFEEGLKIVEELVARVETGALSLDKALQAYERGAQIVAHLRQVLEGAEVKLKILNEKGA